MEILKLHGISKQFGGITVLKNISFQVEKGEIFFVIGPSGCGKTTLLRIITGFTHPDSGKVLLAGRDITKLQPSKRNIGLVFQNYALWPHMTVWKNVAFGLEVKKLPPETIRQRVEKALQTTRLESCAGQLPTRLSGGQQQRTALARALVTEPGLLLLDEPLSNLDAKLREEMRSEIRRIQKETGITMIYVTHDQKEAMTMGSRIAVMNDGVLVQSGAPMDIYSMPADRFTATFLGEMNMLEAVIENMDGPFATAMTGEGRFNIPKKDGMKPGQKLEIGFRPENISLEPGDNLVHGKVSDFEYGGDTVIVRIDSEKGNRFTARMFPGQLKNLKREEAFSFSVPPEYIVAFPEKLT